LKLLCYATGVFLRYLLTGLRVNLKGKTARREEFHPFYDNFDFMQEI